jgi:hypothetical protein
MATTALRAPVPATRATAPARPAAAPAPARARPAAPAPRPTTFLAGPPTLRLSTGATVTAPGNAADLAGGGEPLLPAVRAALEQSFRTDLRAVRVHTDTTAQAAARGLAARAFTYGNQIFLGAGERPTDLALMGHEVAHVLHQQGAPAPQRWTPGSPDVYEDEAHRASSAVLHRESFHVKERTKGPRVQRLGLSDALDYFADKANLIPGFRMFTIILGVNPINMSPVARSAANILRALVEFLPGGGLIVQALDRYGVFDKVGAWVEEQIRSLGLVGSAIKQAVMDFLHSLSFSDIFDLGGVWQRAKRIFTEPIDRILTFAKGLVDGIIKFVKEAILRPLAKLAEGTRGYDLLKALLGQDPVTGDPVERSAERLIGGFMKLIGEEEVWENIKKANALARAWAWFQGAAEAVTGFVREFPHLFVQVLQSLTLEDVINLPAGFAKVVGAFGDFVGRFIKWAGDAVWNLLQIIFEAVAPGVIPYVKKVAAAFKTILKNPIGFVGNLVKAGKLGFQQFADHIGAHLKASFIEWLTGSLEGVYIPKALDLREIVKFVLSVLGLTWANVRAKLVKAVGEPVVKGLETAFDFVVTLVRDGPAAAWEKIKEEVGNLKDMVLLGIMDFVIETVVKKAVEKVLSLLVPGGAFIQAVISIYDTIMVFVEKLKKIIQVAMAFIDGIMAIASGEIAGAAGKVESTLAGLLTLAINFLAGFLGLGKIADKVMNIINTKVRAPIDKALDKVIDWVVKTAKKLFAALFGKKGTEGKPDVRTTEQVKADIHRGVADGTKALKEKGASPASVQAKLPPIQSKYRLTSLKLAKDSAANYHIAGSVNPDEAGEVVKLGEDLPVKVNDQLLVKVGKDWQLGNVDSIDTDKNMIWHKVTNARVGHELARFIDSYLKSYELARPFDPKSKGDGPYKNLVSEDPPDVGPFKPFTSTQKARVIQENRSRNKGSLRSDKNKSDLVLTKKRTKGSKVDPQEVNIDHKFPRSLGGFNSYANAQVLSFSENLKKLDKIEPPE